MAGKVKGAAAAAARAAAAKKAKAARARAKAAAARRRRQAKKKKDCGDKKVSQKQKQKLRKASPSKSATKKVNKDAKKPLKCPTCGRGAPFKAAPPSKKKYKQLAADHIVPFDQIVNMKGFACLSKANQKKVVNNPDNFRGVCPPCNYSRQDTKWDKWKGHKTFGMTSSGKKFASEMSDKAPGLAKKLNAQIGSLL